MISIADLAARYSVSRQQAHARIKAAGIQPTKRGNRSFFTDSDVAALDEQHRRLREGFSLRDTVNQEVIDVSPVSQVDSQLTVPEPNALAAFAEVLASAISQSSVKSTSALQVNRDLHEAAERGYLLSSKQLAACLGIQSATTHGFNQVEHRAGFTLERAGRGVWKVYSARDVA